MISMKLDLWAKKFVLRYNLTKLDRHYQNHDTMMNNKWTIIKLWNNSKFNEYENYLKHIHTK